MKTSKLFSYLGLMLFFASLSLTGCFTDWQGEGNLTINLGGSERSMIEWAGKNDSVREDIKYNIKITENGKLIRELNPKGTDVAIKIPLPAGTYTVNVKAYYKSKTFLYATGTSAPTEVKAGKSETARVEMEKKYYNIGDTGPGGGKIFYVDPKGFTVEGYGYTAHYLEVAKDGWYSNDSTASGDLELTWWETGGTYPVVAGTKEDIGAGRNNTRLIIQAAESADASALAAEACDGYVGGGLNDWFLPSIEELKELYTSRSDVGGILNNTIENYWSSVDAYNGLFQARVLSWYTSSEPSAMGKGSPHCVRPIRAF
ncbi:MAG: DUF1566 domain-containing protein [Treponema sp.]|jgi:hypothetical protein|nr:DUF1566 domain-containing protein [Treponema sp.]